jgi:hypothetical protein
MAYTRDQFEAMFQLVTALSHQCIRVDFDEMMNWCEKIVGPDSLTDPQRKEDLENLRNIMHAWKDMQSAIVRHGVPVRNPRGAPRPGEDPGQ